MAPCVVVGCYPPKVGFRTGNPLSSEQTASDCRISGRAGGQARQVCVHGWCDCDQGGAGEGRAIADLVAAVAGGRGRCVFGCRCCDCGRSLGIFVIGVPMTTQIVITSSGARIITYHATNILMCLGSY